MFGILQLDYWNSEIACIGFCGEVYMIACVRSPPKGTRIEGGRDRYRPVFHSAKLKDTALFFSNVTMNICYLDYDAVLHDGNVFRNRTRGMYIKTPGRSFFEWMPILDDLLAPYPDLKIVLSTTWVRELGFNEAKHELSASLQERVIGSTFLHPKIVKAEFDTLPRGMQIWNDAERRKPAHWFALDDDAYGWPAWCRQHLIQTSDQSGLSDPAVQERVRQTLAGMYRSPA
jgi:hypothetical protein